MLKEKFYSNLHNVIIPLYGFKSYHYANHNEDNNQKFIGRTSIIDKLSSWLKESPSKYTGAYLITGYRGMGKTSFVYEAIKKLKENNKKNRFSKFSPNDFPKYIPVTVNVGNELLETKDLLAMICKLAEYEFDKATRGWYGIISRLNTIFVSAIILYGIYHWIFETGNNYHANPNNIPEFLSNVTTITNYIIAFIIVLFIGKISNKILYLLWKITDCKHFITIGHIKNFWDYLLERINAELTVSSEGGTSSENSLHKLGMYFKYGKTVAYPIADVPEMQEMLVKLLELAYEHRYTRLRFIFIIDELDKISPKNDEKIIMPEYNSSNIVNGNSTERGRQKLLAELIANMKYFISSSRAKFIFVTGYDMYEATLSDISNREFNIHSIFNGQINVSSFFRKTEHFSGIDSMMEQYICNLLIDHEKKKDGTEGEKEENKGLKSYSIYYREHWKKLNLKARQQKEYQDILERRIIFLHSFLTYLVYVSNGSPKKMAIYIEKNIRTKEKLKDSIAKDKKLCNFYNIHLGKEECDYYLYFDSRNLMRISFVNYLIYPMIRNLVDKSNIYNDKLLVSTSFMLSNLYKFHKSGFSMRNLEYMPELLDINKTPELRDFIGGIVEFLTQTHIDEVIANLYKYKFPARLSEEITFFSKTSEEISYLFNFSHDELLSVKNLYMKQLQRYKGKYEAMAIASLHHMLGDIYMLEEDYELAIYEFQEALSAIRRQEDNSIAFIDKETSRVLFLIRVSLKLGLAYEKRKTFDTAYLTYEHLICTILEYIDSVRSLNISNTSSALIIDSTKTSIFSGKSPILVRLKKKESLFNNIRIMYLAPLAKLFVLEKMDLGGFTLKDIKQFEEEFKNMSLAFDSKNRPLVSIDFYSKYGDIMYYKNIRSEDYMLKVKKDVNKKHLQDKNNHCKKHWKNNTDFCFSPCVACMCYNKSIMICLERILSDKEQAIKYEKKISKSLFFLEWLFKVEKQNDLPSLGYTNIFTIANALVGMGNCLLGCDKEKDRNCSNDTLTSFFGILAEWAEKDKEDITVNINISYGVPVLTSFMKSVLYYWGAAKAYALIGEYKSAYNMNCQILDALYAYYRTTGIPPQNNTVIIFCRFLTEKAIQYSFEHYDHINSEEINKIKSDLGFDIIDNIDLDYLSNFPDIETVIYKFYQICLISNNKDLKTETLKKVINSRQLGCDKTISTLTQNIQNLDFKEKMNEQILFLLIPETKDIFERGRHKLTDTIKLFTRYLYNNHTFISLFEQLDWDIFDNDISNNENRFLLIKYLISDSMFCLNKISDLLTPLYSTTLYNNEYIGSLYEKGFIWNHLLIAFREIVFYIQCEDKEEYICKIVKRYNLQKEEEKEEIKVSLKSTVPFFKSFTFKIDENVIKSIYLKIWPNGHRHITCSYLIGNALNYYNRSIEMHTSGKTYKEMMKTLYFLEDDLRNDSCYLNFAIELFYLNTGYIQKHIDILSKYYYRRNCKGLFDIDNYINN